MPQRRQPPVRVKLSLEKFSFVGNASGADLSRADTYPVNHTGLIVNRLLQGGERFQALTLTAPGSVTFDRVGIFSKTFQPPIGPAFPQIRGAVLVSKKWLVLKPLISTISGRF